MRCTLSLQPRIRKDGGCWRKRVWVAARDAPRRSNTLLISPADVDSDIGQRGLKLLQHTTTITTHASLAVIYWWFRHSVKGPRRASIWRSGHTFGHGYIYLNLIFRNESTQPNWNYRTSTGNLSSCLPIARSSLFCCHFVTN